jgi:hypothetical protein
MISRQGSQLNRLGEAAAFDISFKQFGQSGFIADIKILGCGNIFWTRERVPVRNSRNTTKQGCFCGCGGRRQYRFRNRIWLAGS